MTHRADATEALTNSLVGLPISWAATFWLLPLLGLHPDVGQSTAVTMLFFALSVARSWVIRRAFRRFA